MYLKHFNFNEMPFSLTPDTHFYVDHCSHKAALNMLLVALNCSEGFVKIVGEVGTGKTLLGRVLLDRLLYKYRCVYIPNPYLTPCELKLYIAQRIGMKIDESTPSHQLMTQIFRKLCEFYKDKKQVVIVVDEAQTMPIETLECLRLLTNLETEKRKLLQVVIIGQPELDDILSRTELRQMRQRIVFSEYLSPLNAKNIKKYVESRVSSAQNEQMKVFTSGAIIFISIASSGIARVVNVLCHKGLLSALGKGKKQVGVFDIARAVADTQCIGRSIIFLSKFISAFSFLENKKTKNIIIDENDIIERSA